MPDTCKYYFLTALAFWCISIRTLPAQQPTNPTAADIANRLHNLHTLGSVLYIAAHPDDENTGLIAWLSNYKHYDTRYISLTRGDGGQNLIGPEMRELLGVLRTEELLAARRIDGGKQSFSCAYDFGYSKTPQETLAIWDSTAVLADLVWAIRKYKPDVLINRFWHGTERPNHGHHTASAQLGLQAFKLAGDPTAFPEQLRYVEPWQPKRILCNISWWFYGGQEAFEKIDKSRWIALDVSAFYPDRGLSNRELAALSRSQHSCQAMGTMSERQHYPEYFEHLAGTAPVGNDLFDGINTTWNRLSGGQLVHNLTENAIRTYDHNHPERSIPILTRIYQAIEKLPAGYWRDKKLDECRRLIADCMGLYVTATTDTYTIIPGQTISVKYEVTLRQKVETTLQRYRLRYQSVAQSKDLKDSLMSTRLNVLQPVKWQSHLQVPADAPYSTPYWLIEPFGEGIFTVKHPQWATLDRTPRPLFLYVTIETHGLTVDIPVEVAYKWEDPARGELWRATEIVPPANIKFTQSSYVFPNNRPRTVTVEVRNVSQPIRGKLMLNLPKGWKSDPETVEVDLSAPFMLRMAHFTVTPGNKTQRTQISASLLTPDGKTYNLNSEEIKYDHIVPQLVLRPAVTELTPLDITLYGRRVGYIMGAGDEVPAALRDVGYEVTLLNSHDVRIGALDSYDAILVGIRAYNTQAWLAQAQEALFDYAQRGGVLIVQYQTNYDILVDDILPLQLKIGRDRITDQKAEVTFLQPTHRVVLEPNRLSRHDFDDWVQERGIYFAQEWDNAYTPLFSMQDPNEPAKQGALLVAPYGQGHIVYTGLVFFRQMPAGVAGSYRLMANLIGLGKSSKQHQADKKRRS